MACYACYIRCTELTFCSRLSVCALEVYTSRVSIPVLEKAQCLLEGPQKVAFFSGIYVKRGNTTLLLLLSVVCSVFWVQHPLFLESLWGQLKEVIWKIPERGPLIVIISISFYFSVDQVTKILVEKLLMANWV